MDIHIHSNLSVAETVRAVAEPIKKLRAQLGERFWFSDFQESSKLSSEVIFEDFGFHTICGCIVSDTTKEFDGLEVVARTLRKAISEQSSIVVYADSGELFPKVDYVSSV
jgi:hypothetical protein